MPPQARHRPGPGADRGVRQPGAARPASPGPWLPSPRLTGLGSGLFCLVVMFLLGCLDHLLFGASMTVYGVLFVPVCVLTALWVRGGDLLTAPVVVPIAFAVGLLPVADGKGGLLGRLMGLFTGLATQAGWLYGGTLVAGVIVLVRRVRWVRRRRRRI
ncbi:membrane protein [Streptomyces sp. MMG1121]|nr:membrane protein [Streptomyces sp. MMG1121]